MRHAGEWGGVRRHLGGWAAALHSRPERRKVRMDGEGEWRIRRRLSKEEASPRRPVSPPAQLIVHSSSRGWGGLFGYIPRRGTRLASGTRRRLEDGARPLARPRGGRGGVIPRALSRRPSRTPSSDPSEGMMLHRFPSSQPPAEALSSGFRPESRLALDEGGWDGGNVPAGEAHCDPRGPEFVWMMETCVGTGGDEIVEAVGCARNVSAPIRGYETRHVPI